jgi:hypothetical protein
MRTIALALLFSLAPVSAFAAEERRTPPARFDAPFEFRDDVLARPAWEPQPNGRDSLKNGAIIGAVVGGLVLGTYVGLLCYALKEPSDPSCVTPTLLAGGIGAGAGAAAGAGIDALFHRRRMVQFTVKF